MVLVVMDAHRCLIDVRLEGIIRVGQGRKRMPADRDGTLGDTGGAGRRVVFIPQVFIAGCLIGISFCQTFRRIVIRQSFGWRGRFRFKPRVRNSWCFEAGIRLLR